jgi:hypothetical protein
VGLAETYSRSSRDIGYDPSSAVAAAGSTQPSPASTATVRTWAGEEIAYDSGT